MNSIRKQDIPSLIPYNGIKFSSLSIDEQEGYIKMLNVYREWLSDYLIKSLNLKHYDECIEESDLKYCINKPENMDCYQFFSKDKLKYFYVRNNVYIERLDNTEKLFLKDRVINNNIDFDDDVNSFIHNTFSKVIKEDIGGMHDKKVLVCFGPNNKQFFTYNDSIVIGFNYDEFEMNGLNDDEWNENHIKQLDYLYPFLNNMIADLNRASTTNVAILKYGKFSIIKRKV